jgi:hypothetical protein
LAIVSIPEYLWLNELDSPTSYSAAHRFIDLSQF